MRLHKLVEYRFVVPPVGDPLQPGDAVDGGVVDSIPNFEQDVVDDLAERQATLANLTDAQISTVIGTGDLEKIAKFRQRAQAITRTSERTLLIRVSIPLPPGLIGT